MAVAQMQKQVAKCPSVILIDTDPHEVIANLYSGYEELNTHVT